ncbi:MAG TPA: hypothetical protein VLX44_14790 [Xanthobacteraceae bacterium]|nr:hypothetical protein [Xanthobacteraceae bacterium]
MMKTAIVVGCLGLLALTGGAQAGSLATLLAPSRPADQASIIRVDWQDPATLPPQFRNHCSIDSWSGRPYCADHCGPGYQFYYCTPESFGCCRVGFGYCDWRGHLRCHP